MELINLPRLRHKELQSIAESSLRIAANITEVQPALANVNTQLEAFKQGMLKEQASAADKSELDKQRDRLLSGFMQNLKAEKFFPHQDQDVVEVLDQVDQVTRKHGPRMTKLSYSEETSAIDNLLSELGKIDTEVLNTSITRWIPLIQSTNNDFKAANSSFISDRAKATNKDSASDLAPLLHESIEGLITLLFAHTKITATEPILTAYRELEILIKSHS
ncbi:MAG: hypothetical protein JEZ14_02030 [Marinilabiliaceae bacterium]|nr:hypothetical protein [Marinilabiliaceae bacterium]